MLMPVLEYSYNRHIAKIPNCKMRRMTHRDAASMWMLPLLFLQLLLVPLQHCQAVDPAASGGGSTVASGAAAGNGAVAGSNSLNGATAGGTLSANLTELGSPDARELVVRQFVRGGNSGWSRSRSNSHTQNSWRDLLHLHLPPGLYVSLKH